MSAMHTDVTTPRLGVLGGMGPMASAWFMVRLTALTPASHDQDHIPTIVWSDPRVPDRSAYLAGNGPDPWPWLRRGLLDLTDAGASVITIPCNTAHYWYDTMCRAVRVPILDIRQAVVDDLHRHGITGGRIGLLGTIGTLASGMYQRVLQAEGYACVVPDLEEQQRCSQVSIDRVKANRIEDAFAPAAEAVEQLRRRGADAIVLGCTELPIALPQPRRDELGITLIDSIDALARAAIAWHVKAVAPDSD